jgi:predicted heme/steroid binding protein
MKIVGFDIDGINVRREGTHFALEKDGEELRCDFNELDAAIEEMKSILAAKEMYKSLAI